MNFKVRKEVGDINLRVISKKVVFRVISLDETVEEVSIDREEKRTNNQVLGRASVKTSKRSG